MKGLFAGFLVLSGFCAAQVFPPGGGGGGTGSAGQNPFTAAFTGQANSSTLTITHNLNTLNAEVVCRTVPGVDIIPITVPDASRTATSLQVVFPPSGGPWTGNCRVQGGGPGATGSIGPPGPTGTTGPPGPAGADGEVTSIPGTYANNQLFNSSGTTGDVIKPVTMTGIPKLTVGVPTAAVAGTDYVVPSGNVATATALAANPANCAAGQAAGGVAENGNAENCFTPTGGGGGGGLPITTAVLKGDNAGGATPAAPGVDFAPATEGLTLLKADGGGGFAPALPEVDYIPPVSTGAPDFSGALAFRIPTGTGGIPAVDCDELEEVGRIRLRSTDPLVANSTALICTHTGATTYGWRPFYGMAGTTPPSACNINQLFFKTDATPGQNLYGCTTTGAPGTWTLLGGGGTPSPNTVTAAGTLTSGLPVFGGGTKAVVTGTRTGNTTEVVTQAGAKTAGRQATYDASGNLIASAFAVGGGTSGTSGGNPFECEKHATLDRITCTNPSIVRFQRGAEVTHLAAGTTFYCQDPAGIGDAVVYYDGAFKFTTTALTFGTCVGASAAAGLVLPQGAIPIIALSADGSAPNNNFVATLTDMWTGANAPYIAVPGANMTITANGDELLFEATGGTGGAAGTDLNTATGDISTAQIENLAVTAGKLANGAVTPLKVSDGDKGDFTVAAGVATIEDGAITNTKLADDSVTTAKIGDRQATAPKLNSAVVQILSTTAYLATDNNRARLISFSNSSPIAVTLPVPSASGEFTAGWFTDYQNRGPSTMTITPTPPATIDTALNVALAAGQGLRVFTDGADYFTQRGVGGTGTGGGIPDGDRGDFTCVSNTCTVDNDAITAVKLNAVAATSPKVGSFVVPVTGVSYTMLDTNRGRLVKFSNAAAAIGATLPAPGAVAGEMPATWFTDVANHSPTGTVTITSTAQFDGSASPLRLAPGEGARIFSNGTDYFTNRGGAGGGCRTLVSAIGGASTSVVSPGTVVAAIPIPALAVGERLIVEGFFTHPNKANSPRFYVNVNGGSSRILQSWASGNTKDWLKFRFELDYVAATTSWFSGTVVDSANSAAQLNFGAAGSDPADLRTGTNTLNLTAFFDAGPGAGENVNLVRYSAQRCPLLAP